MVRKAFIKSPIVSLVLIAAGLSGCATTPEEMAEAPAGETGKFVVVNVVSFPEGSMIAVNGIRAGPAPILLKIPVEDGGSLNNTTVITADNGVNVRTPNSSGTGSLRLEQGELVPSRITITPNRDDASVLDLRPTGFAVTRE